MNELIYNQNKNYKTIFKLKFKKIKRKILIINSSINQ